MGTKGTKYKNEFNKENYSRVYLYLPKAEKEALSVYCKEKNIPVAEFVKNLIYDKVGDIICKKDSVNKEKNNHKKGE